MLNNINILKLNEAARELRAILKIRKEDFPIPDKKYSLMANVSEAIELLDVDKGDYINMSSRCRDIVRIFQNAALRGETIPLQEYKEQKEKEYEKEEIIIPLEEDEKEKEGKLYPIEDVDISVLNLDVRYRNTIKELCKLEKKYPHIKKLKLENYDDVQKAKEDILSLFIGGDLTSNKIYTPPKTVINTPKPITHTTKEKVLLEDVFIFEPKDKKKKNIPIRKRRVIDIRSDVFRIVEYIYQNPKLSHSDIRKWIEENGLHMSQNYSKSWMRTVKLMRVVIARNS